MIDKFKVPKEVADMDISFGVSNIRDFVPGYSDIPDEFKDSNNKFNKFASKWFFNGLTDEESSAIKSNSDDFTVNLAMRHLRAVLGSWDISHEHKEAAVAYLASKWLILED